MSYDPNSAYEPPRRAYYGQQQQPAPMQNGYNNQFQEQYNDYAKQSWDNGYDQQYDQYDGYEQDIRQGRAPHSPQYQDGYHGGYQSPKQHAGRPTKGYGQPQQRQERQYDARYQQRPERGRQQTHEPQRKPSRPQLTPSNVPYQMPHSKPNPRNARVYHQESQLVGHSYQQTQPQVQAQSYQQPPPQVQAQSHQQPPPQVQARSYQQVPPQVQAQSYQQAPSQVQSKSSARPQTAPQQQKKHDPSKMTMDEWKAKERERMHTEAMSPETLAWDNAFPTFPMKRDNSRPPTANRESAEHVRPSTSNEPRHEERPNMSRGESHNSEPAPEVDTQQQQQQQGPRLRKGHSRYFQQNEDQSGPPKTSPPVPQRPQFERQPSNHASSPVKELPAQQWQVQEQRHSPPSVQAERRQPPQQRNAPAQTYSQDAQRTFQDERAAPQQPRQPMSRAPPMQPIDTRQAQQQQTPAYMDHQPLSPANLPQRPSTAQGPRSPLSQSLASPTSAYPQAQSPQGYGSVQPPPSRNFSNQQQRDVQGSVDNLHGSYGDNRVPAPATTPPQSREEQIEAEMPDFDSAAPGGTSLLHKRTQNSVRQTNGAATATSPPLMTNRPPQLANPSVQSLPVQKQRLYNRQDPSSSSLPEQARLKQKQGGITDGFVFGVPGEDAQQQPYDNQYYETSSGQNGFQYQRPDPPPQPPFAREQQPRRSMDDARQMPYRQRPPPHQQRIHQNGPPPRGPYPPQQRQGMDRNTSGRRAQPGFSDPMQERGGSAPPMRPGLQAPPGRGPNGAPLTQQRSAPEQDLPRSNSNPDALPQHPAPVRPGLVDGGFTQQSKSAPTRNYPNAPPASHQRQVSLDLSSKPVTAAELDQLRAAVDANPHNNKQALLLAKKLVEASSVLASEGGRADRAVIAKNRERYIFDAHKRVKKLVTAGYAEAQFYLADCYGQGLMGLEVDPKEAFNLYQAAAKNGHPEAAYRTAMCCELGPEDGGGTRKDYAKAVQWYRRGAALGDPSAMFKVGIVSLKGLLGQQRNVGEGVIWLKRAAESGNSDNPQAFYELATLYESANTNPEVRNKVVADDQYALELFQKAANLGHKYAQFRLGQAYEYGNLGLGIDNRASISWYTKAAAQAEHQAELALSGWYLTGAEGILDQSDTEAYLWARKAASSEPPLAKAMFAMGYFTETGIGCPKSIDEAKKWYGRAASYKFPKAQERLEELRKNGVKSTKSVNGKLTRKDQKRRMEG